jgi:uncharacterized membrane protein YkoI
MNKLIKNVAVATVLIGGTAVPVLADNEQKVELNEVSAPAKAEIEKQVGKDGTIESIEKEQRNDKVIYEVEFRDKKGAEYEIVVSDQGKLLAKWRD